MGAWLEMAALGPPTIRKPVHDAKRRYEFLQLYEGLILACAKDLRDDLSRVMIDGRP